MVEQLGEVAEVGVTGMAARAMWCSCRPPRTRRISCQAASGGPQGGEGDGDETGARWPGFYERAGLGRCDAGAW